MILRSIALHVKETLRRFPAVALVGPRQSGKTTLAKTLGTRYFDLEQEGDRVRIEVQWDALTDTDELVILDEAQTVPSIFQRLRGAIDARRAGKGRFLLLGSVSPALMRHVSESLAGRLALVELSPLNLQELPAGHTVDALWLHGGYPDGGILDPACYPQWQTHYLDLLTQRDLPNWGLPAKPQVTHRLLRMLAAVNGQLWNASQLGRSLGLSHTTVNSYLDYLEGAFLLRRLPPYHANIRKRLVKSPRVYWRDSGLLHALLNILDDDDLLSSPAVGISWEGFVIEQILTVLREEDVAVEPGFLRTSDGYEVDLVLDFGRHRWAIEIKLSAHPSLGDLQQLHKAADLIRAERRILVSRVRTPTDSADTLSCSLPHFLKELRTETRCPRRCARTARR